MAGERGVASRRRWAKSGIALGVVLAVSAVGAGAAMAATWSAVKLPDGGMRSAFFGVACPASDLCLAVGGNNTIASSTDPTGSAGAWRVVRPDGEFVAPFATSSSPDATASSSTYNGQQIRGISCPSTELCVAASFDSQIYSSTDPGASGPAWKVLEMTAPEEPNIHMGGISCPTASLCVAVGLGGKVVSSTDPTGDRGDWVLTTLEPRYDLRGVSCPSPSLCVAVGNEGTVLFSNDPTGGASAWHSAGAPGGEGSGESSLNGVSCPSAALCVTGNAGEIIHSTDPTSSSSWKAIAAGTGLPVKGVSCPSTEACAAIDNNADAIASIDPTGGPDAWWFQNVIPFRSEQSMREGIIKTNGTYGISCAGVALCVGVGMDFQIISSTDPFARPDASLEVATQKRPRVVITRHPAKRLRLAKGGNRVGFRFRGVGEAARFACKLHGGRFAPCKSPVHYRVGRGKHVFRVRAIGPKGLQGPPSAFHFRVGALTERPPVGSCPEGSKGSFRNPCVRA